MAINFAAVVPHSPLLIPNIGKDNAAQFVTTKSAFETIKEKIVAAKLDTILILSSKGATSEHNFTININQEYKANFEIFGDLVTDLRIPSDLKLISRLREELEAHFPLRLATDTGLDYASSVPLFLIFDKIKIPIIPIAVTNSDHEQVDAFALALQSALLHSKKRIGILASADLSHRLSKQSPAGYSPKAKKIDQRLIEILRNTDHKSLVEIKSLAEEVDCEDMPVLDLLLGLLHDVGAKPELVNYEALFGVGHLTLLYSLG